MTRILPQSTDTLNNPSHSLIHRVVSVDTGSPQSSIDIDSVGNVTIASSVITPSLVGGTAVGSNIIYKSTTGAGTVAGVAHQWIGGTDGATVIATMLNNGNVGIGTTNPTAVLHLKAGTATASTAPLKFTSGTLNTTAEAGAVEFLTDAWYGTITTGAARKTFAFLESPTFTGTPSLPTGTTGVTQSANDNSTKIATTAYADLKLPLAGGTMTGPIIEQSYINLASPGADHSCTGTATNAFNSGATIAQMNLVMMGTASKWIIVDADAIATCKGLLGIALEAKNDTQAMLVALPGSFVRDDSWSWTVGDVLYAGETAGAIQNTIPTGADGVVKPIGQAITATVIFFNPSMHVSTVVA
jgi:hypothetical protein